MVVIGTTHGDLKGDRTRRPKADALSREAASA